MAAPSSSFALHGRYGKSKVRVLRVVRHSPSYNELTEVDVQVLLEGALESSYTKGDNSVVVPTDTMKNTVYAVAKMSKFESIEDLGIALGKHFLTSFAHIYKVTVNMKEKLWNRFESDKVAHDHVFLGGSETRVATVVAERSPENVKAAHTSDLSPRMTIRVASGIDDLKILKTTQSGFENYIVDKLTSLKPSADRIFCTIVQALWDFDLTKLPNNFQATNERIRALMLKVFAGPPKGGVYSQSVQETMYKMATAALKEEPCITSMRIVLPNIHHFLFDLERFGLENKNEIFFPTDDPSGNIQCCVSRKDSTPIFSKL